MWFGRYFCGERKTFGNELFELAQESWVRVSDDGIGEFDSGGMAIRERTIQSSTRVHRSTLGGSAEGNRELNYGKIRDQDYSTYIEDPEFISAYFTSEEELGDIISQRVIVETNGATTGAAKVRVRMGELEGSELNQSLLGDAEAIQTIIRNHYRYEFDIDTIYHTWEHGHILSGNRSRKRP